MIISEVLRSAQNDIAKSELFAMYLGFVVAKRLDWLYIWRKCGRYLFRVINGYTVPCKSIEKA